MSKRHIHQLHSKLSPIRPLHLLLAAIFFLILGLYSARQNNLTTIDLRDQVIKADKENGDTEQALRELREYMYSHMNTELASGPSAIRPPIQLKYRYERLMAAEKERVSAQNATIYNDAQKICEQKFPIGLSGSGRIPCIQDYVANRGVKEQAIPDSLYKFDFTSPSWSPDVAGWSLVISGILFVVFLVRFCSDLWIKRQLSDDL